MRKFILLMITLVIVSPFVHGEESYKQLSHEYNLVFEGFLRDKIEQLPKHAAVELFLKDGTTRVGYFTAFSAYDDGIWIRPVDSKFGCLSDDAYDIRELQDVKVIVLHQV